MTAALPTCRTDPVYRSQFMLTLSGNGGTSRRDFLRAGALGFGGLTLPDLLRLRAAAGDAAPRPRSVIMVCLLGGPSHHDMYDMKPDAPSGVRSPFKQVKTNVPGFDLCEYMPLQATIADKLAVARSVQWQEPMQHEMEELYTGYPKAARRPAFGAVVSKLRGTAAATVPAYVSIDPFSRGRPFAAEEPQYVGASHGPFRFGGDGVKDLALHPDLTPDVLHDRRALLTRFDAIRRDIDARGEVAALDQFQARALDMILSPRAREAFDLSKEPARVRERYTQPGAKYVYDNDPTPNRAWPGDRFLLARRLVEAGVPVVVFRAGQWDYHGTRAGTGSNFVGLKSQLPHYDRSVHALVTDLHDRGLDKDVAVLVWGEFGRTPKINNFQGRDHWPSAGFALFAGGGWKTGQVIGSTDARGAEPKTRPLTPQNVLATVYTALGIDPTAALPDFTGRPVPLLDDPRLISELI